MTSSNNFYKTKSNIRTFELKGNSVELFFQNGNEDDKIEIVLHSTLYRHVYKDNWTPVMNEKLAALMEPDNEVDKYAVCVKKENVVVGHLPLRKNGKFAKMIFYFQRADQYATCEVIVTGKTTNLGDGDGMHVTCNLRITDVKRIDILEKKL